jgi:hypothetical protein
MPRPKPLITAAAMLAAERRIPELAAKAGHAAYKLALKNTGAVVVKTNKGTLVERKADGTSKVIKPLITEAAMLAAAAGQARQGRARASTREARSLGLTN